MASGAATETNGMRLGFLRMREHDGAFRCGLLVIDAHGMPLELRVTDPLAPTRAQRIAYGRSIHRAVARACTEPLLEATEHTPDIVLVDYEEFLSGYTSEIPFVCVAAPDANPPTSNTAHGNRALPVLRPPSERCEAVGLLFPDNVAQDECDSLRERLQSAYDQLRLNLTEPFARIERALQFLETEESSE